MPIRKPGGRRVITSKRSGANDVFKPPSPITAPVPPAPIGGVHGGGSEPTTPASAFGDISPSPSIRSNALASGWSAVWISIVALILTGIAVWRLSGDDLSTGTTGLPSLETVWWAAWLTAASSCLGAAPFFLSNMRHGLPSEAFLGASNAVAGGMMLAASISLMREGMATLGGSAYDVVFGILVGVVSVAAAKAFVEQWGGAETLFDGLNAADAQRAALLCLVMFLHSATEGIGIGVSFGAKDTIHDEGAGGGGGGEKDIGH